jgi:hypothetical protein
VLEAFAGGFIEQQQSLQRHLEEGDLARGDLCLGSKAALDRNSFPHSVQPRGQIEFRGEVPEEMGEIHDNRRVQRPGPATQPVDLCAEEEIEHAVGERERPPEP